MLSRNLSRRQRVERFRASTSLPLRCVVSLGIPLTVQATFAVTLITRSNEVALSNMPEAGPATQLPGDGAVPALTFGAAKSASGAGEKGPAAESSKGDGWKLTRFETTPRMSTYLVAYACGAFEHIESSYTSPISGKVKKLRVYSTKEHKHQLQLSLDAKAQVLPVYVS